MYNKRKYQAGYADSPEVFMTEKELRKAKKDDLIEMLYYLRTEIDELKAQNDQLRAKIIVLEGAGEKDADHA